MIMNRKPTITQARDLKAPLSRCSKIFQAMDRTVSGPSRNPQHDGVPTTVVRYARSGAAFTAMSSAGGPQIASAGRVPRDATGKMAGTVALLTVLLVTAGWLTVPGAALGRQASPVIVTEAAMGRFVDRVEALGTLRANESVTLTATVAETITAVHFEDGQRVETGAILVEMTNEEEHALIEGELSTLTEAKEQYERLKPLVKRGAASDALLDQRRREYQTAKARLRAIESRLKDRLVIAPFNGVLGLRNVSVGMLIAPGDVVTTLDDDSVMKLDFAVSATYLAALRTGLPIEAVSPAFPHRTFRGTVSAVDSRVDPVTRSITVRAMVPNPDHLLKPGLLMRVVMLKNARDALVIPEEALIPSGRENAVLIVDPTMDPPVARRRAVTIGSRRPGEVEILSGLAPGTFVVVDGTQRAQPGQPVSIIAVDSGGEPLTRLLSTSPGGQEQ
jgi:membrane fusion protein (multidrug efflux system)